MLDQHKLTRFFFGLSLAIALIGAGLGQTPAAAADPAFQKKWDALKAAAKKEGRLVIVSTTGATRSMPPLVKAFEKKFGVEVTMAPGGPRAHIERITAERSAGRYLVDIGMLGPTEIRTRLIPKGFLQPILPLIIVPDILDTSKWYQGQHWWWDDQKKYDLAYAAAVGVGVDIYYNKNRVSAKDVESINSIWDLLNPKFKGMFTSIPPGVAGAGSSWYALYAHPEIGPKWAKRYITEMGVRWTKDTRIAGDWVAQGVVGWGIAIGGARNALDKLAKQGAPVAKLTKRLKEQPVLSGGGGINQIIAFDRPAHPNATKLFLNWFLSREGQTTYVNALKAPNPPDPSLREDVPPGNSLPEERREPGKKYYYIIESNPGVPSRRKMTKELVPVYRSIAGR